MKISAYTTAFNLKDYPFDWRASLKNYLYYCDEVIVAIPFQDSGSAELISESFPDEKRLFVYIAQTDDVDGGLKNEALQRCVHDTCLQMDLDEQIYGGKEAWSWVIDFLQNEPYDCLMLPVLNLFHDVNHYKDIGFKFRLHKRVGRDGRYLRRGIVNFAKNKDGTFDPTKSDSTELIDSHGNLAIATMIQTSDTLAWFKLGNPSVIHYGYVDFKARCQVNKNVWHQVWKDRGAKDLPALEQSELNKIPYYEHGLVL